MAPSRMPDRGGARRSSRRPGELAAAGDDRGAGRGRAARGRPGDEAQAAALVGEGRARAAGASGGSKNSTTRSTSWRTCSSSCRRAWRGRLRSAMLKSMRAARKAAARVFLARDEKRFADALAHEPRRGARWPRRGRRSKPTGAHAEHAAAFRQPSPRPDPRRSPRRSAWRFRSSRKGACPFECCTYRTWTVERATDVSGARATEGPAAFRLSPGQKVEALTGVVVVSRPGRARAPREAPIEGLARSGPGTRWTSCIRWARASGSSGATGRRATPRSAPRPSRQAAVGSPSCRRRRSQS